MHFIPTYSSWLNQVERFFALITDKAIRRSFTSVKQLVQRIDQFVMHHNANSRPFRWTATANSTIEKLHRLCSRISGTGHSVDGRLPEPDVENADETWRPTFDESVACRLLAANLMRVTGTVSAAHGVDPRMAHGVRLTLTRGTVSGT
jgi:hypothetical protein